MRRRSVNRFATGFASPSRGVSTPGGNVGQVQAGRRTACCAGCIRTQAGPFHACPGHARDTGGDEGEGAQVVAFDAVRAAIPEEGEGAGGLLAQAGRRTDKDVILAAWVQA